MDCDEIGRYGGREGFDLEVMDLPLCQLLPPSSWLGLPNRSCSTRGHRSKMRMVMLRRMKAMSNDAGWIE
jgi:hypothetical protein